MKPDLLYIANDHRARLKSSYLDGPADFVIEIISEESVSRDRVDKFYEYQDIGVREYLIVDPREGKQRVDYYWLDAGGQVPANRR